MQSNIFGAPATIQSPVQQSNPRLNASFTNDVRDRDRKGMDAQLLEIDRLINETNSDINSAQTQVKNGITMRRKRELEDKLESLEKERSSLRGKLRASIGK